MTDLSKARLGVLGGSGLYSIEDLNDIREIDISTPYGKPSDKLRLGKIGDTEVVFLARHGRDHTLLPSEVPYQANIWAMKSLGVKWIISASAVGSLKEEIKPLDLVIPDQFIDRTNQRPSTFFGGGMVAHVSMAEPICSNLSKIITEVTMPIISGERTLHVGGTYLCMEGPAFSTKAESNFYRSFNCSVIGMTNHSEARLATEAEIAYVSLSMSTDYDCWHPDHDDVTVDMIISNLHSNASIAKKIISQAAKVIGEIRPSSSAHESLKYALLTDKKKVPDSTLKKIELFTEKYWN